MVRQINDPEHPLTLEELNVVQINHVEVGCLGLLLWSIDWLNIELFDLLFVP